MKKENKESITKENKKENLLNMYSVGRKNGKTEELTNLLNEYKDNPIKFMEEVIGVKLTDFQKEMIEKFNYFYKDNNIYVLPTRKKADLSGISYLTKLVAYDLNEPEYDENLIIEEKDKPLKVVFNDLPMPEWRGNGC